ncbi:MAG: hypothetical protein HDS18_06925 [Bacteroides sp.]|nr:hypothetical protein [Bacteroides sp.]
MKVEGRTISVIANDENATFDLYSINGATVALGVESYSVNASGVYVVKVGSKAVTVLVK